MNGNKMIGNNIAKKRKKITKQTIKFSKKRNRIPKAK